LSFLQTCPIMMAVEERIARMTMMDRNSPGLGGLKGLAYRPYGDEPMLSGAFVNALDLPGLIAYMTPQQQRLFALDCAERVLPYYEFYIPVDTRIRTLVTVTRRYARGLASRTQWQQVRTEARRSGAAKGFGPSRAAWAAAEDDPVLAARGACVLAAGVVARVVDQSWSTMAPRSSAGWIAHEKERHWQQAQARAYLRGDVG
jgi:hypothetical protein